MSEHLKGFNEAKAFLLAKLTSVDLLHISRCGRYIFTHLLLAAIFHNNLQWRVERVFGHWPSAINSLQLNMRKLMNWPGSWIFIRWYYELNTIEYIHKICPLKRLIAIIDHCDNSIQQINIEQIRWVNVIYRAVMQQMNFMQTWIICVILVFNACRISESVRSGRNILNPSPSASKITNFNIIICVIIYFFCPNYHIWVCTLMG